MASLQAPADTTIWIGDPNCLPHGPAALAKLRLVIVPFAGPFIQPATAALLATDYPDLTILTTHHNAASTAEMAVTLLLATAKQVSWRSKGQP